MSNVLFGLALISASLQTGWALLADDQITALVPVAISLLLGSKYALSGFLGQT